MTPIAMPTSAYNENYDRFINPEYVVSVIDYNGWCEVCMVNGDILKFHEEADDIITLLRMSE